MKRFSLMLVAAAILIPAVGCEGTGGGGATTPTATPAPAPGGASSKTDADRAKAASKIANPNGPKKL